MSEVKKVLNRQEEELKKAGIKWIDQNNFLGFPKRIKLIRPLSHEKIVNNIIEKDKSSHDKDLNKK